MRHSPARSLRVSLFEAILILSIPICLSTAHAQTFTVLHTFTGTPDGAQPTNADLINVNGVLYGTTWAGGAHGFGTVFSIDATGKEVVLYSFTGGTDGGGPNSGLVRDKNGFFYGTTAAGGDNSCSYFGSIGCGVTYKLDSQGHLTILHTFTGLSDGSDPFGVILDSANNLYGVTTWGGDSACGGGLGCGVVYKLNGKGVETVLYSFTGGADDGAPQGILTRDGAGNLYGITNLGPGTIFELSPSGKETVLHTFTFGTDGGAPNGPLLRDSKGGLYGTASAGGNLTCADGVQGNGCGVIFEIAPNGKERVLYTFQGPDGTYPLYGLAADSKGNGYGTTSAGGNSGCDSQYQAGCGVVFEITSKGVEKVLHTFNGTSDGGVALSGVIIDGTGNLYGNTYQGGDLSCNPPIGCGTVFKLVP